MSSGFIRTKFNEKEEIEKHKAKVIESYFQKIFFWKVSLWVHFVKNGKDGKIFIVLYVDDLIFTYNSESLFDGFKESMKKEFAKSDLGKMS